MSMNSPFSEIQTLEPDDGSLLTLNGMDHSPDLMTMQPTKKIRSINPLFMSL